MGEEGIGRFKGGTFTPIIFILTRRPSMDMPLMPKFMAADACMATVDFSGCVKKSLDMEHKDGDTKLKSLRASSSMASSEPRLLRLIAPELELVLVLSPAAASELDVEGTLL